MEMNRRRLIQLEDIIDEEKSYEETMTRKIGTSSIGKQDFEFQKTNPDEMDFSKTLNRQDDEELKRNNTTFLDKKKKSSTFIDKQISLKFTKTLNPRKSQFANNLGQNSISSLEEEEEEKENSSEDNNIEIQKISEQNKSDKNKADIVNEMLGTNQDIDKEYENEYIEIE